MAGFMSKPSTSSSASGLALNTSWLSTISTLCSGFVSTLPLRPGWRVGFTAVVRLIGFEVACFWGGNMVAGSRTGWPLFVKSAEDVAIELLLRFVPISLIRRHGLENGERSPVTLLPQLQ